MSGLAALGASNRLDVLRPAPARLERGPTDDPVADVEDVHPSLVRHWADLVGRVEALLLQSFHGFISLSKSGRRQILPAVVACATSGGCRTERGGASRAH